MKEAALAPDAFALIWASDVDGVMASTEILR